MRGRLKLFSDLVDLFWESQRSPPLKIIFGLAWTEIILRGSTLQISFGQVMALFYRIYFDGLIRGKNNSSRIPQPYQNNKIIILRGMVHDHLKTGVIFY